MQEARTKTSGVHSMRLITSGLDETWEDRPPILDIMLLGIEQDRIRAEIAERKREAKANKGPAK